MAIKNYQVLGDVCLGTAGQPLGTDTAEIDLAKAKW